MRSALALALALAATTAQAGVFGQHIGSQHWPSRDYNNVNPGLYYRSDTNWTVGAYRNSYRRLSVYAGKTFATDLPGGFEAAVTVAAISGYEESKLMVAPSLASPKIDGWRVRFVGLPRLRKDNAAVLHLMIEREF